MTHRAPDSAPGVTDDPTFPRLHGRPARGWLNDPNGLCRVGGRYHVFFQYNPNAPVHGDIHWGHVSSTDLLHWTEEPVALRPRPGQPDAYGCWSGCLVVADGVPTAVYSAVRAEPADAQVVLATSDTTLREWAQAEQGQAGRPEDPAVSEVRDPFVFSAFGHRWAVQGAGRAAVGGAPQLLLYACDDLHDWQPRGALLTSADPVAAEVAVASVWECPNLFRLGDRWVLVLSLWRAVRAGEGVLSGVRYLVGDLQPVGTGLHFVAAAGGVLDEGPAFYAPQVLVEPNRVLLWGWSWELDRTEDETAAAGWAGVLTLPRELALDGGRLVARPAAELVRLRAGRLATDRPLTSAAFEIASASPVTLVLSGPRGAETVVDRAFFAGGPARILIDGSMVEAFGDGRSCTTRAYPGAGSSWSVDASATAYVLSLA